MKKLILILALISTSAFGATALYEYDIPAFREDGAPMALEEIAGYSFYLDGIPVNTTLLSNVTTSFTIDPFPNGNHCITGTTTDTDGQVSIFSPEVCGIGKGKPNHPQNNRMTINNAK